MASEGKFSVETTIYVSTKSKLNFEQTQTVTDELLHLIGYPSSCQELKFRFIDAGDLIEANASVDSELRISVNN